jgi:hypothetical protein
VFLLPQKLPGAYGTEQTCLLRPVVAKGESAEKLRDEPMETTTKTKDKLSGDRPKNKGGAPKKRVRRELIIRVRMTATERFQIDNKAKAAGMRSSTWIRASAKSAKIIPRLTAEERRILWMLAELSNNLNQLTKLAHQLGLLRVVRQCEQILKEVDETLKHLNRDDRESDNG